MGRPPDDLDAKVVRASLQRYQTDDDQSVQLPRVRSGMTYIKRGARREWRAPPTDVRPSAQRYQTDDDQSAQVPRERLGTTYIRDFAAALGSRSRSTDGARDYSPASRSLSD